MEIKLQINESKCIGCDRCISACPSAILLKSESNQPKIDSIERCIECGHCVAICPTNAICHSTFPDQKVHNIDNSLLPSSEQVLELIKSRRSNRNFSKAPIPIESIHKILEAAHRAPTASNLQKVSFTVITSPEKLREVSLFTINTFTSLVKIIDNPFLRPLINIFVKSASKYVPLFKKMDREFANGNDYILRGATTVIFFHTPKSVMFGKEDSNLAYQNASLMAESLGVAQFYTGFICSASRSKEKKLAEILGLEDSIVHAGIALGMPNFKFKKYIDKMDIKVNYL